VKIVSDILRHASISITLDTYSHVIPGMAEDAVNTGTDGLRTAGRNVKAASFRQLQDRREQ
jgi:hypothetical protein